MGIDDIAFLGFLLLGAGIIFLAASAFLSSDVKSGGVLLLGPIPIIFGNDRRLIYVSLAFAAFVLIVWLLARKLK